MIYGHNMKNGSMFHDLHNYEDESFLPDHSYVYIYTPDRVLRYRIFTAYRYDDRHLLYSFDYATEEGAAAICRKFSAYGACPSCGTTRWKSPPGIS